MGGSLEAETLVPRPQLVFNSALHWLQKFSKLTKNPLPAEDLLKEAKFERLPIPATLWGIKVGAGKESQSLEDFCLQCW